VESGARVAFDWRQIDWPERVLTEVGVRFEPIFDGTLVSVEHSGFERLGRRCERTAREYRAAWAGALVWVAGRARVASSQGVETHGHRGANALAG
jgi:hypothetical protein